MKNLILSKDISDPLNVFANNILKYRNDIYVLTGEENKQVNTSVKEISTGADAVFFGDNKEMTITSTYTSVIPEGPIWTVDVIHWAYLFNNLTRNEAEKQFQIYRCDWMSNNYSEFENVKGYGNRSKNKLEIVIRYFKLDNNLRDVFRIFKKN